MKTNADWQRFNNDWADSLRHQFCPVCKDKRENRALMEMDLCFLENIAAKANGEETQTEFIN